MKLTATPPPDDRAQRLWDLFAEEVGAASTVQLMGLMAAFRDDPAWASAPPWARAAFRRIAERMAR